MGYVGQRAYSGAYVYAVYCTCMCSYGRLCAPLCSVMSAAQDKVLAYISLLEWVRREGEGGRKGDVVAELGEGVTLSLRDLVQGAQNL